MSINSSCLISELNLKEEGEDESVDEDSSSIQSEEKDSEQASEGTNDASEPGALATKHGSTFQKSYLDGTLPDLINSGRPLGRRRTLGHVSDTLEEVRRQVALTRRQSLKIKAQVDKLQESRDGPGWSQHRERVTEEVLSVLRLLHPLTEPESSLPEPTEGENHLDVALAQLQSVARKLAISHTKQDSKKKGDDSAVLQQALRDRDEAMEKKKAMEAELLRSKTEMMGLNNQLLEAVQKRLEISLELEAWKEDLQLMLQQQLQSQQLAEQAQRKPSRLGILRRNNRPPIQRPANFSLPTPTPPTTNSHQIFVSRSAVSTAPTPSTPTGIITQRNWKNKLRRGKNSRQGDLEAECGRDDDGFQVVSLD
ncbi:bicaudal-D-related protein 2-like isoform X2 [Parambassis ranga]|nr:BICD family-like cargo adapter 2 isoform X2 [Parambassis ranga]